MADYVQQLPYLDEGLLELFEVDFRMVHNIQADVLPENIVAAFETALDYGKY